MKTLKSLKVCFVGVGSIATRHIRNLYQICQEKKILLTIDIYRSGKGRPLAPDLQIKIRQTFSELSEVPDDYDCIFVTNPTKMHIETLYDFHNKGKNFFIEKPIDSFEKLKEAMEFPYRKDSIYYVACPLRYTNVIHYVKTNIDLSKVRAVRCICSSYLPDWRPGTDYAQSYSARKELGGGVSIDLIHEWDYIQYLFGQPEEIKCYIDRISDLNISSDDIAIYIAKYADKYVELHLDYFGRKNIRIMELFTEEDTIICDLELNQIQYLRTAQTIKLEEERDDYQRGELENFLSLLAGNVKKYNSAKEACITLGLTKGEIYK